jgi:hypothetical protein
MTRLLCDSRITALERLDRARCVLVDGHSLSALANLLESPEIPSITPRELVSTRGGPWMAHIIQTMVLYDTILFDSVLFELEPAVSKAHELLPEIIKGLFIRDSTRQLASERVEAAVRWLPDSDLSTFLTREVWTRWMWLDHSEKPLMDRIHDTAPRLIPAEYASDEEITTRLDGIIRKNPIWTGVPAYCLNSDMTATRAHFYLELARELGIPLNIDPVRSAYLLATLGKANEAFPGGVPARVVQDFINRITAEEKDDLFVFDLTIPPVAELVLRTAQRRRISLGTAVLEVRNSKNAKTFRDWCSRLFSLREEGGIGVRNESRRMKAEFTKACETWASDAAEGVDYKTRKISLGDLPLVGKILKAVNMDEFLIKDPVISSSRNLRYFLFLNDLLRPPRPRVA